ncbi:hypothetical protein Isop_3212 [Isosphaera pallida ATCC 43644]|uniref:Uncharacterized protein n=1 Tax=Isosphaera pallida (strain ATCC 43644 / DSM 9630 / IS1B) TaxID=575540 RepID=E8R4I0_ISOPI|nr:hypothetical protein [Isosphaera pallida]ADV63775.1 hypothetical protein Isop_3212 [Isosphaera pallida ATCC 43644]
MTLREHSETASLPFYQDKSTWSKLVVSFLILLALVQFVSWAVYLYRAGLHLDVVAVAIQPAASLVETGRLDDYNLVLPFQIIRDFPNGWNGQPLPYWMVYTAPALYFAPFVAIWGSNDVTAFWVGQTLLLLTLLASLMVLYRHQNSLAFNLTILVLVLAGTFKGSYLTAATNLPAMMMMVWTWRYRRTLLNHPLRFGLLLGLAHEFRPPDTLIWLIALTPAMLDRSPFQLRVLWRLLVLVAAMLAVVVAFRVLSFELGMIDQKRDYLFVNLFESFNKPVHPAPDTLFHPATLSFLFRKHLGLIRDWIIEGQLALFNRFDVQLLSLWAAISLGAALNSERASRVARDALTIILFTAGIVVFGHTGINLPRYYDTVAIALALFLLEWGLRSGQCSDRGAAITLRGLAVMLMLVVMIPTAFLVRNALVMNREFELRENGRHLAAILPRETRVLVDHWEVWRVYAGGKTAVFWHSTEPIPPELIRSYRPQAYIHFLPQSDWERDMSVLSKSLPNEISGLKLVPGFPLTRTHPIALYVDDHLAARIANSPYASWINPDQTKAEVNSQADSVNAPRPTSTNP